MVLKRIRFERPLDGVSLERFREVWEGEHAPRMARRTQALRYLGTFFGAIDGTRPHFEHAVTLWYRDAEHQRRAYAGPRDPTDPIGTVMGRDSVLLETVEFPLRRAPEAGLIQTWYAIPAGENPVEGRLPERWMTEIQGLLDRLSDVEVPDRCVVSMTTAESTNTEIASVIELGWSSAEAREAGDAAILAAGLDMLDAATRYVVTDQVAIIGDLAQPVAT